MTIHNSLCKRFSESELISRLFGKEKDDLFFTSGKILLKHKRMNIFFCNFLGQVERDEQIILISNNSNTKWKNKSILDKQRQIWDRLIMTAITNAENLQYYKRRFSLIIEKILAFASSTNSVREVKNLSPKNLHNDVFH